jgi:hypothetical protein
MKWFEFIILIAACACSSPSSYAPNKGKYGYSDKIIDPHLRMVNYLGNASTKKKDAALYAKFRAIEICLDNKSPYTHFLTMRDNTFEEQSTEAVTYYPSAYYGASPYYGRYDSYMGYGPTSSHVYTETHSYPKFDVFFECVSEPMDARMSFNVISHSQLKDLVKDMKGGVQVENILPDSPNKNALKPADIIISLNGTRVGNIQELFQASRNVIGDKVWVEFFRNGEKKKADIKFRDVTDMVAEAQAKIIKDACKKSSVSDSSHHCK